jgi:hypothetical protein
MMLSFYHGLRVGTDNGFQQSLQCTEGTATDSRSHSDIQVAAGTQIEHPLRQFQHRELTLLKRALEHGRAISRTGSAHKHATLVPRMPGIAHFTSLSFMGV